MDLSISLAVGFFVLGLVLAALEKEHRRLWLTAAGSMVPFCMWITVASFFRLLSEAPVSVLVAPGMAVILAIVDRKYRVLWIAVVVFSLLGAGAIAYFFFWILSMF